MRKINVPPTVDFWAQAHFKQLTHDTGNTLVTSLRAADFERTIHNVILPLLLDIGTPAAITQAKAYGEMCKTLHDVALRGDPEEVAEFPPDAGRQLILDRLDSIDDAVKHRLCSRATILKLARALRKFVNDFRKGRMERRTA